MVIGLLGDNTTSAPKVVEEVRRKDEGPAIAQHLLVVDNSVQDHLNKRNPAIHMLALVMIIFCIISLVFTIVSSSLLSELFLSSEIRQKERN